MGDVDAGCADPGCWKKEPGRERDDVGEQVGVGESEGQGVGGAVGEAANGQAGGVERVASEASEVSN